MKESDGVFTNNHWKKGTGEIFQSINPANGEPVWKGKGAAKKDVEQAIQNAAAAASEWSAKSTDERSLFLDAFTQILSKKQKEMAEAISKETGKPLWDSLNEVQAMLSKIKITLEAFGVRCAGIIHKFPSGTWMARHRPHGVVAIIGPYNFPGHLPNGQIVPALVAGNTIVFKPSELTPLSGELLVRFWHEAGLPKGVLNLVQGGKETGQALIQSPEINGIFFTGSYQTGRRLAEQLGPHIDKILALELGGNNPLLISQIDDLDGAIFSTIQSSFLSSGQRCTCARRLIVVKNEQNEKFVQTLTEKIAALPVGSYTDSPEPYMGPVITKKQADQLLATQENLKALGGKSLLEMKALKPGTGFLSPGLMDVTAITGLPDEEYFGPFLQLIWVKDLKEGVKKANDTKYGLTAGIFSTSEEDYQYFYNHVKAGVINWNTIMTGVSGLVPFGGAKCSGNFRPSGYYSPDFCAYPVASLESPHFIQPSTLPPGLK